MFTPQEVFDLETLLQHALAKVKAFRKDGTTKDVTRDMLGTLHVNVAVLDRELGRLLRELEAKHAFSIAHRGER